MLGRRTHGCISEVRPAVIPDQEYLQLYQMFSDLLEQHPAAVEKRIVYYHPELFIEMAREIIVLRKRIQYLQHLELDYQIKADECIKLCDQINQVKAECRIKHLKLDTDLDIRTRK